MTPQAKPFLAPFNAGWLFVLLVTTVILGGYASHRLGGGETATVAVALLILSLFTNRETLKPDYDLLIGLVVLCVVGVAASALSRMPDISFARLGLYGDLVFLGFAYFVLLRGRLVDHVSAIYISIIISFLLVAPQTLLEYFSFSSQSEMQGRRYIAPELSFYGHIRHFSYHAFLASCCATLLSLRADKYRVFCFALTALSVIGMIASTGRGAILAYLFFVLLLLRRVMTLWGLTKVFIGFLLAVVVLLLALWLTPAAPITESLLLRSRHLTDLDQLLSGRIGMWQNALIAVSQSPLLGLGPEGYRWSGNVPNGIRQPHNSIVQLIVEFGYFGAVVISATVARVFWRIGQRARVEDAATSLVRSDLQVVFLAALVYSMVDGVFYHQLPLLHFSLLLAVWYASSHQSPKNTTSRI